MAELKKPDDMHVLIVGAGVSGLLLAHGLQKAGIRYTIFDSEVSAERYRPREWNMGIHWSRPMLASLLPDELANRLTEAQSNPYLDYTTVKTIDLYEGVNGTVVNSLPTLGMVRYGRRKLRKFLTQGIDVKYNCKLVNFSEGPNDTIEAAFESGEKATGTILVGTDGPRSAVRRVLFGPEGEVSELELVNCTVLVHYDAEKSRVLGNIHPFMSAIAHPKGWGYISLVDVPDPEKPETWLWQIMNSWLGHRNPDLDQASRLAAFKENVSDLPEPFRSATLWLPDDQVVSQDPMAYWISRQWDNHNGKITLAGDAAHPMSPHRGQGLNNSINDVFNLVAALKKVQSGEAGLKETITAHDEEVVKRGADEVQASKNSAMMMLDWNKFRESPLMKQGLNRTTVTDKQS